MTEQPLADQLQAELAALRQAGLLRTPQSAGAELAEGLLDACSNDYLGYAHDPVSRETLAALASALLGAGASRLVHGSTPEHDGLEQELADWVGQQSALLFTSGYAANVGAIPALAGAEDLLLSDQLNHASIIDGCRLSRAEVARFPHLDLGAVDRALERASNKRRVWVVTESYFSMDGTSPDLASLSALCRRHGAFLYVDEAHALGVFGRSGAGLSAAAGALPDVLVGTLGKAVGAQGAFVAGSAVLRALLWNRARSFVFSTAMSPLLAALVRHRLRRVRHDEAGRNQLHQLCRFLAQRLASMSFPEGRHGPIFPVLLGDSQRALAAAERLREAGILAQAIRPPTVPQHTARLRLTLRATLTQSDVARVGDAVEQACSA